MLVAVLKVFQTTEEVEGPQFAQIDENYIKQIEELNLKGVLGIKQSAYDRANAK